MTRIGAAARGAKDAIRTVHATLDPWLCLSAHAEQQLHRQLIEALVAEPAPASGRRSRDQTRTCLQGAVRTVSHGQFAVRDRAVCTLVPIVHERHDVRPGRRGRAAADQSIARRVDGWPAFDPNASQNRRTVRRSLVCGGRIHRMAEHIGLNLTPKRRTRSAAAEADAPNRHAHLREDRKRVAQAERNAFQNRTDDVPAPVARRQPDECGAGIGIAMRRPFAHQIRRPEQTVRAWRGTRSFGKLLVWSPLPAAGPERSRNHRRTDRRPA